MNAKGSYMSKPWLKFYPEGVSENVDIPEGVSVPDMIEQAVEKYGKKTAMVY